MDEKKVALIPRVVMQGALGPKEYGLLLTDQRSIFVLENASKAGLGAALGGVIGAAIAQAASSKRTIDYELSDPSRLAQDEKSIVVPHASLRRLQLQKKLAGYSLKIEYTRPDGTPKKLQGIVAPPIAHLKEEKARGVKPKATIAAYAGRVRDAFQKALPPGAAAAMEWSP